jgi:peptidoglycan/LPS O-acetylase OafA/YrhL
MARVDALDGLRGVAVAAVVVHHARPEWLPGGWLGVDVFFVLSGFLITSLLLDRRRALGDFWARRARRLVPALVVVLTALAITARVDGDATRDGALRADGLASLASVVNWRFVAGGDAYFDRFADPSPLRHLWSLSVEGQYYLVWPFLLALVVRRGRRFGGGATLVAAVASALAMALVADVDRAYYGTDTHAHGLLAGSALALFGLRLPVAAGRAGLGALAVAFATVERVELIPVAVLATACVVASPGARVLGWAPLRGLGRISYGVYLWHWPVLVLLDAPLAAQLAATLALALASWWVVERPVLAGRGRALAIPVAAAVAAGALVLVVPPRDPATAARDAFAVRSVADAPPAPAGDPGVVDGRVVVVGDSVAYTLFPGLRAFEDAQGLEFLTAADTGCPLDVAATTYEDDDGKVFAADVPPHCDWPRTWPAMVARTRPETVVALWGLWDVFDHEVGGAWLRVGTPEWTAHLERMFGRAADVLTARGARLVVLSTPYVHAMDGARVDALNSVFREVARRRAGDVVVVDVQDAIRAPGAERWDAVHFTEAGAHAVGAQVVPRIAAAATGPAPGERPAAG